MKFYLSDTGEHKEIAIRRWEGSNYSPDCFGDLEVNFPRTHYFDESKGAYSCTSADYYKLVQWWTDEVTAWNNGGIGDTVDYSECADANMTLFAG